MAGADRPRDDLAGVGLLFCADGCWIAWLDSGQLSLARDSQLSIVSCAAVGRPAASFCHLVSTSQGVIAGTTDGCLVLLSPSGTMRLAVGASSSAVRNVAAASEAAEAVWTLYSDGNLALVSLPPLSGSLADERDARTRIWCVRSTHESCPLALMRS